MEEKKPSVSAEQVTAIRAAESMRPKDERVCYDPFARHFLGPELAKIVNDPQLTETVALTVEQDTPGAIGCVTARTRYIDDYLRACIAGGIEQLVILGAGYDTRPYRFDELKAGVRVFEMDEPITQREKIDKVVTLLGSVPDHVTYIPVDFDAENLAEKLLGCGYDAKLKTLFIWEGVTMYITAQAVDDTLRFIVENSGKGSSIIFNYIFQSVVDGTCELEYAEKIRESYIQRGEPLIFGIPEGTIKEFLSERGFSGVTNVTGKFFKTEYFKGKSVDRNVCSLCGFATATVKQKD